jgi:hypothetical protein
LKKIIKCRLIGFHTQSGNSISGKFISTGLFIPSSKGISTEIVKLVKISVLEYAKEIGSKSISKIRLFTP